jgi:hypothetical protein
MVFVAVGYDSNATVMRQQVPDDMRADIGLFRARWAVEKITVIELSSHGNRSFLIPTR